MYCDVHQWLHISRLVLEKGKSRKQVVRETGISRKTVRKMLANPLPPPVLAQRQARSPKPTRIKVHAEGRRVRAVERQARQVVAQDWMRWLAHGRLLATPIVGEPEDQAKS